MLCVPLGLVCDKEGMAQGAPCLRGKYGVISEQCVSMSKSSCYINYSLQRQRVTEAAFTHTITEEWIGAHHIRRQRIQGSTRHRWGGETHYLNNMTPHKARPRSASRHMRPNS